MAQPGVAVATALQVVGGSAHPDLVLGIAARLGTDGPPAGLERFPDGEVRAVVDVRRGADVYVVQPTGPPVADNLVELLLLLDACRRQGAGRLTAVVPYVAYARQDRRTAAGQGIGLRVVADALAAAGADRLLVVDPHSPAVEAASPVPVVSLRAGDLLADALRPDEVAGAVVVSPDLGAVARAEHLAVRLGAPVAVVRKVRLSGTAVHAEELAGDVAGRPAVVVDDMISTGGTVEAAVRLLHRHGAAPHPVVVATHGLFVGPAARRLASLELGRVLVTDTLPVPAPPGGTHVCPVAPLLAAAIGHLHRDEPVDEGLAGP